MYAFPSRFFSVRDTDTSGCEVQRDPSQAREQRGAVTRRLEQTLHARVLKRAFASLLFGEQACCLAKEAGGDTRRSRAWLAPDSFPDLLRVLDLTAFCLAHGRSWAAFRY